MTFQFESLNALLTMEGHGPYVWACYGMVFFIFALLVWNSVASASRFKKQQRALHSRQAQSLDTSGEGAIDASS